MVGIFYCDFRTGCGSSAKFARFYRTGLKVGFELFNDLDTQNLELQLSMINEMIM